jgi:hypothetical protein
MQSSCDVRHRVSDGGADTVVSEVGGGKLAKGKKRQAPAEMLLGFFGPGMA